MLLGITPQTKEAFKCLECQRQVDFKCNGRERGTHLISRVSWVLCYSFYFVVLLATFFFLPPIYSFYLFLSPPLFSLFFLLSSSLFLFSSIIFFPFLPYHIISYHTISCHFISSFLFVCFSFLFFFFLLIHLVPYPTLLSPLFLSSLFLLLISPLTCTPILNNLFLFSVLTKYKLRTDQVPDDTSNVGAVTMVIVCL